jgi:hypothetical protein
MKSPSKKKLGKVTRTERGFSLIEFQDYYSEPCSLQASSLALYQQPGVSAVWLGCEQAKNHHVTGKQLSPRMHLHRNQVEALVKHLQKWLETGKF